MKAQTFLGCLAALTMALTCITSGGEETNSAPAEPVPQAQPSTTLDVGADQPEWQRTLNALTGHIEIGIARSSFKLTDNDWTAPEAHHVLGSIDELQAEDDSLITPVVGLYFNRYFGIEGRLEEVKARTFTDSEDNHSDGTYVVKGPVAFVVARLPLDILARAARSPLDSEAPAPAEAWLSRVVPFVGFGHTFFSASFEPDAWWAKGYSSPESYASLGSPAENRNKYYREISVKDDQANILMLGLQCRLMKHLSVDINWTRTELDLDSSFSLKGAYQQSGTIPIHYEMTTIGARFCF